MRKSKQQRKNLILKSFGEAVRNRRLDQKMTQEELGEAAQLHRTYITDIENGLRNLSFLTMMRLAIALRTPLSNLLVEAESNDGWHDDPQAFLKPAE
ncbi:MAG: XRE family transcriptional regulator [Cyanobacteria bacterium DS2.3.42]|nr:XRE family transcriptional regulator [Cyanobacteria bacterium DS2.3.42]